MCADDVRADKVDIDVSLVHRLVATQFPQWADLPIKPVEFDGWDNRTFRLGEHMSVRLPSGPWYALQVEKEQKWLPRLAQEKVRKMTRVRNELLATLGRELADEEVAERLGRTVREVRAVAGLPLDVFSFDPREPRTTQRSSAISSKTSKPRRYPRW